LQIRLRDPRLPVIRTKRLVLRDITVADISPAYIAWLNDPETVKYLEIRFRRQPPDIVRKYIEDRLKDTINSHHFGIYDQNGQRLVGTVTLPRINRRHGYADISFVIGHPEASGKGYASEAVHGICYYAFFHMGLTKLWGGYYEGHEASARVFAKNGFSVEGCLRKKLLSYDGRRVDHILVGLLAEEFKPAEKYLGPIPPLVSIDEDVP